MRSSISNVSIQRQRFGEGRHEHGYNQYTERFHSRNTALRNASGRPTLSFDKNVGATHMSLVAEVQRYDSSVAE